MVARTGAAEPADFREVIVGTMVQDKAITFPTGAKLMRRDREWLVRLAETHRAKLRQSDARVGRQALIRHGRYAYAEHSGAPTRMLVYVARQKRGLTRAIKRAFRPHSAFEALIGHVKAKHRTAAINWPARTVIRSMRL